MEYVRLGNSGLAKPGVRAAIVETTKPHHLPTPRPRPRSP